MPIKNKKSKLLFSTVVLIAIALVIPWGQSTDHYPDNVPFLRDSPKSESYEIVQIESPSKPIQYNIENEYFVVYGNNGNLVKLSKNGKLIGICNEPSVCGDGVKTFPPGFVFLKDPFSKLYSMNSWRQRNKPKRIKEDSMEYFASIDLELLSYKDQMVSNEIPYTNIPTEYSGLAVHRLRIGDEEIQFKSEARRSVFSFKRNNQIDLYFLPQHLAPNSTIAFLNHAKSSYFTDDHPGGTYVIRPISK